MGGFQNLILRVGADMSALKQQLYRARTEITGFHNFVQGQMTQIAAALTGTVLTLGVGDAIRDAVKVEGAMEQIKRLMGDSAQEFIEFSKTTSEAFGMSRAEALDYGRTYANLTSIFTKSTEETMQTTQELMKASAIVSSATGRSMEDVMFRIRSGLLGNTEAVEDLGITVYINMIEASDAMKKFANGKSWNQLDFRLQQQIRHYAILEQVQRKFGDEIFKNTGFRINQFAATLKDLKLEIGNAFLPLVNVALPYLTAFAKRLVETMAFVAAFSRELFGVTKEQATIKKLDGTASSVKDVGTNAAASAKKMKGFLAGFDEINSVPDPEEAAGGASDGMSAGMGDPQMTGGIGESVEEVNIKAREMAQTLKDAFAEMSSFVTRHKDIIIAGISGIATSYALGMLTISTANRTSGLVTFWMNIKKIFTGIAAAAAVLVTPIGLVVAAVGLLTAAFVYFYRSNEDFRNSVNAMLAQIGPALTAFYNDVLVPLGSYLADVLVVAWDSVSAAASYLWQNVLVPLGSFLVDVLVAAWDSVSAAVAYLWQDILVPIGEFLAGSFLMAWDAIATSIGWIYTNVFEPLGAFLMSLYNEILKPIGEIVGGALVLAFGTLATVAKDLWQLVLAPLATGIFEVLGPAFEALKAVVMFLWKYVLVPLATSVAEKLNKAFEDLKAVLLFLWKYVFVPLMSFISKTVLVVFGGLVQIINKLWKTVLEPLAGWLLKIFTDAFNSVLRTVKSVIDGIKTALIGIFDFITGVFTGDWKKAFQGLADIVEGIFTAIVGVIKLPLNILIDGLNALIRGLNKINIDVPDWVPGGGGKFGINIDQIPKLARGGIVNSPTMAMVGEAGPEMVVPLENTGFVDKLSSALGTAVMSAMQMNGNQRDNREVVIKLDGNVLARAINPYTQKESARVGTSILSIT